MTPETVLDTRLQEDFSWRIKELSSLIRACNKATGIEKAALTRAAAPLIYAHFEGYFVNAINAYLTFVSQKRIKFTGLRTEFWALRLMKSRKYRTINSEAALHSLILEASETPHHIFKKNSFHRINGQSNLKSKVLQQCLNMVGFPETHFEPYYEFIDEKLLSTRNFVAHGQSNPVDHELATTFRDNVLDLMRITKREIEDAVASTSYRS